MMMSNKVDESSEERSWSSLNNELLSLILSRLVISDYLAFQSVCKSWKSVTPLSHPFLPTISLDHASPHDTDSYKTPHLMYLNHKTRLFHFHDPTRNANYSLDIPQLLDDGVREVQLYYASCGWLLLCKDSKYYFFFNPSTKVEIDLPDIVCKRFDWMCFSDSPTSSKCEIVGIISQSPDHITMGALRLGQSSWELLVNMKNNQNFIATNCSPVAQRGNFYILGESGNLGKFRILPEGNRKRRLVHWKVIGKSHKQFKKYQNLYLVESDGDLVCVATLDVREVHVLKLDCDRMWQRVHSLNNKALYVSYWASFAREVMAPGVDNKIYFPRFYDNKGLFYCLATRQWRNFPRSFSSKGCYNTSEIVHSVWTELPSVTDSSN